MENVNEMQIKEELDVDESIEFECSWNYHELKDEKYVIKTEEQETLKVQDDEDHHVAISKEEETQFNELGNRTCDLVRKDEKMNLLKPRRSTRLKGKRNSNQSSTMEGFDSNRKHRSSVVKLPIDKVLSRCVECHICFKSKQHLVNHIQLIHVQKKTYDCDICKKIFKNRSRLSIHRVIHSDDKPFICGECKKGFNHKGNLKVHMRIHTGNRPFQCILCEKSFTQKIGLITHVQKHTGERPFHCSDCKKSFTAKQTLDWHVRTHTGEKPFHCNYCDRSFSLKLSRNVHMRTHTGEKPFHCSDCKKSFSVKQSLDTHMRTHTGEKPFHCNYCEKSFSVKQSLIMHMRTHTGEKPFHCVQGVCCCESFSQYINKQFHSGESQKSFI